MTNSRITLNAPDCRQDAYGDWSKAEVASVAAAHELASELNAGIYSITVGDTVTTYESDGISEPYVTSTQSPAPAPVDSTYGTRNGHAYLNGEPTTVRIPVTELQAGDVLAETGTPVQSVTTIATGVIVNLRNARYGLGFAVDSTVLVIK